jgi:NodT family efflux transporter outer membrane factor (OMF) lipoprotein
LKRGATRAGHSLRPLLPAITPAIALAVLAGCAAGPDYVKPALALPPAWKLEAPWRESAPGDTAPKGPWWQRYGDARLDALETGALADSPTLAVAGARLAQARATLAGVAGGLYPQVGLGTRGAREKISADRPLSSYTTPNRSTVQNEASVTLTVNYELDLSGRVQRSIEGARASAEQSAADAENTRLVLSADLASAYFNLRGLDVEIDVVTRSIALQRKALDFVGSRHELGAASGLDVAQQQALLDNTLAQIDVLQKQRAQFEHAIATLTGAAAPGFTIAPDPKAGAVPPSVPLGVPSDVLERRPDVASAERAMAAANAQIGVAAAAFYPSVIIGPTLGVDSNALGNLFSASSLLWSLGVTTTQTLFDGGRIRANVNFAQAGYDATVANYRRTVLTAMQEVEDGITGLADLERATRQADIAVASARRVLDLATARYEGGATTYLDVINAQQGVLASERQAAQLQSQRLLTSVFLVKALGGGWAPAALARQQAAAKP